MIDLPINHGVIPGNKSTNWIAGSIPYEVRNPSGDWTPYLVRPEKQYFNTFDTMACVSFATNNTAEIQIKQQTGVEVNFSDRFLAKMSGTTSQGNWVYIVLDTWRKIGVVNEEEWPAPPEPTTRDSYYQTIPQFVIDRAKSQSTDKYDLQYEYIPEHTASAVNYHLKHAPLLITIPGHEITGIVLTADGDNLTVLDQYPYSPSYTRQIKLNSVTDIYKAVVTAKNMNQTKVVLSGDGHTVYKCIPIATDFESFKKQSSVEGIDVPNPIPPSSSL